MIAGRPSPLRNFAVLRSTLFFIRLRARFGASASSTGARSPGAGHALPHPRATLAHRSIQGMQFLPLIRTEYFAYFQACAELRFGQFIASGGYLVELLEYLCFIRCVR